MSTLLINNHDIEPYLSRRLSYDKKEAIHRLIQAVADSVEKQMPIGFSYGKNTRLVLPHAVFLQKDTPNRSKERAMRPKKHVRTSMHFCKAGAQRTIAMDADQRFSVKSGDSINGWKTFDFHKINDTRLLTSEEIRHEFRMSDEIDDQAHLIKGFVPTPDFVRNWNYWFRTFLAQAPSRWNLRAQDE